MEEDGKDGILSFADSRIPHSAAAAAQDSKTQVQARKDKPLTKYPSYVYEYGRSCCLHEPLSSAETTAAEIFLLCVCWICRTNCAQVFVVVTPFSLYCCITNRGLSIDISCCLD